MSEQQPSQILSPTNALMAAASLNQAAILELNTGSREIAVAIAAVALSLSTYAAAMYRREGGT